MRVKLINYELIKDEQLHCDLWRYNDKENGLYILKNYIWKYQGKDSIICEIYQYKFYKYLII